MFAEWHKTDPQKSLSLRGFKVSHVNPALVLVS